VAIPKLIHPVPCILRRINTSVTTYDQYAREPVRRLWRSGDGQDTGSEITLQAQVNWNDGKYQKPMIKMGGGVEVESDGYLLVRVFDLINDGIASESGGVVNYGISRNDRIVQIGRRNVNLYVVFFRDVAFYPDRAGGTLLEIDFASRSPSE